MSAGEVSIYAEKLPLNSDYFEDRFYESPKMDDISRESILHISTLLKYLIHTISENCAYEKALFKPPYLPDVFLFIHKS